MDLMVAGSVLEIYIGQRVYEMHLDPTDKKVSIKKPRRKTHIVPLTEKKCPTCNDLMFNNVCMNINCPSNLKEIVRHEQN